jgi:seryl-tRNA synthetase
MESTLIFSEQFYLKIRKLSQNNSLQKDLLKLMTTQLETQNTFNNSEMLKKKLNQRNQKFGKITNQLNQLLKKMKRMQFQLLW